jgi:hypothetical protein
MFRCCNRFVRRVAFTRKDGVPLYAPHFEGDVFASNQQFRDFLFYKRTPSRGFGYRSPYALGFSHRL